MQTRYIGSLAHFSDERGSKTEWLDVVLDGKLVEINAKGEIRESPNA